MNDEISFSCLSCGQHIVCDAGESGRGMLCPSCGANLTVPHKMDEMRAPELEPEITPATDRVPPAPVHRTSGLAVASLVCSLSSAVICVGWIPGIICGHLARYAMRRNPALTGKSLATAGLIISYFTAIVTVGLSAVIIGLGMSEIREAIKTTQEHFGPNQPAYTQNSEVQTQTPSKPPTRSNPPARAGRWT